MSLDPSQLTLIDIISPYFISWIGSRLTLTSTWMAWPLRKARSFIDVLLVTTYFIKTIYRRYILLFKLLFENLFIWALVSLSSYRTCILTLLIPTIILFCKPIFLHLALLLIICVLRGRICHQLSDLRFSFMRWHLLV